MILKTYQTLGIFPEIIVFLFLAMGVTVTGTVLYKVASTNPVVLVPNAIGVGQAQPAEAGEIYVKAFADHFLKNWNTWNQFTFGYRRNIAIGLLMPDQQGRFQAETKAGAALVDSLAQSQTLSIKSIAADVMAPGIWYVKAEGDIKVYYAGVGGRPEAYTAILMLRDITPTQGNPMCLEVYGFKQVRGESTATMETSPK